MNSSISCESSGPPDDMGWSLFARYSPGVIKNFQAPFGCGF
jgi:hypothetical protein